MTKISVFIPTYNGEKYIAELINSVLTQDLPKDYALELIIIDSGSSDRTVEIIENNYLDKIIFERIPNADFGHGKTRQKAAEMATGDYILFLSQDATPAHPRWAINMIEPFFVSDKIGCVFGRQIPRIDGIVTIKREVATVFGQLGSHDAITLHREKSLVDGYEMNHLNTFFSDVNSAIRKDLVSIIPFREVGYAEDQALAEDMQNAGYLKAYSAQGAVWHSNEYTVAEFYQRKFDEYIGLQESVNYKLRPSLKSLLLGWIRPTIADWKFAIHDHDYSKKRTLKNMILAIGYNYNSGRGKYDAARYINDHERRSRISLEATRKK